MATTGDVVGGDFAHHPFARRFLSRVGVRYMATVNVGFHGRPAAQLWLGGGQGRSDFTPAERGLLRRLHGLLSMALPHLPAADEAVVVADVTDRLTGRELEVALTPDDIRPWRAYTIRLMFGAAPTHDASWLLEHAP